MFKLLAQSVVSRTHNFSTIDTLLGSCLLQSLNSALLKHFLNQILAILASLATLTDVQVSFLSLCVRFVNSLNTGRGELLILVIEAGDSEVATSAFSHVLSSHFPFF
jgi:hypothetical protein